MNKAFEVKNPNFDLSPMTGMSKDHYIEMAKYLLERAFKYVDSIETPISFPVVPGKTYPQPNSPDWRYKSAGFEALERTFTLAGPLIHLDPETTINNINLRDYYCLQIYNALTPGHSNSIPLPEELPDSNYQFTCDFLKLYCFCPIRFGSTLPRSRRMRWSSQFQNGHITGQPKTTGGFLML